MGRLDGKVAIVTGGGRGIGRAEALALAREGARVVVNDLGAEVDGSGSRTMVADSVVEEIKSQGGEAVANYSDISTLDGAESLIWTALSRFGRLDVLVNNAGILRDRTLLNMSEEEWDRVVEVHAKGTFLCTRAAARVMRIQQGGSIINTSSMAGLIGNFGQCNYAFAKAGMYGFTKVAAMELARYNIRVNCIVPNAYTRMTASLPLMKHITEEMLSPDAVAPLVVFLASDMSKDVTGRIIGSHGGTLGNRIAEFKITVSEGFFQKGRIATVDEIAQNWDRILHPQPDLNFLNALPLEGLGLGE
jgi:NAD(P)-dependent dehydrogenase (short-subunit alcohol dehydrogenase family)